MTLTTRSDKGSALTADDHDANILHLARGGGFSTLADMLADTRTDMAQGDILTAGSYRYAVAASNEVNHHLTTAGGIKLFALPSAAGYGLDQLGTDLADMQSIQKIAEARSLPVWVQPLSGSVTIPGELQLTRAGLRGGNQSYSGTGLNITTPMIAGKPTINDPKVSDHVIVDGVSFRGQNTLPILQNIEGHWMTLTHSSFRSSSVSPGEPLVKIMRCLYPKIDYCDFGGKGDGLHGRWGDYPNAGGGGYYGVNFGHVEHCTFFQPGAGFQMHGIFALRYSTFENSVAQAPRIILGESTTGAPSAALCVVDFNYLEHTTAASATESFPGILIASQQNPVIRENVIGVKVELGRTDGDRMAGIKSSAQLTNLSVRNNNFAIGNESVRAVDVKGTAECYHEFIGSIWGVNDGLGIWFDDQNMATRSSVPYSNRKKRVYIRDRQHGELKQSISERNMWLEYTGDQAEDIACAWGKHHTISAAPTGDIAVGDRTSWKGARFTIHFGVACTLKHGTTRFWLAKGADVVVPQHTVLDFVIDKSGVVREVGTSTMSF